MKARIAMTTKKTTIRKTKITEDRMKLIRETRTVMKYLFITETEEQIEQDSCYQDQTSPSLMEISKNSFSRWMQLK